MDRPEDTYTRRVAAILLADVSGFSAMMGDDDERTARDLRRVQGLVQAVVSEFQGRAEPQSGDAIFASFESVVAAVQAAVRIQNRLTEESEPARPLRLRIGVHYGDVLLLPGGSAVGDAINVTARLCALAHPGTVCVSEGVYRQVRTRIDEPVQDLGRQRLKNISDPVRAYLILPRTVAVPRRRRPVSPWVVGIAGAGAAAVVAGAWRWPVWKLHAPPDEHAAPGTAARDAAGSPSASARESVALGVMVFRSLGQGSDTEHAWMRDALRDGLNAQLSGLSKVTIYSKEFIDFLITHDGLSEIEAATKLGITKMVSGSFLAIGRDLRIETHVVDVRSGKLEASVTSTGTVEQFLELQTKMVEGVIARLDLPITDEERRNLLARRNTDADALKLLLEAEGGQQPKSPAHEPGTALWQWLAGLATPAPALADDQSDVLTVLERYRSATEARDAAALAAVYVEFTPEQQAAQQRYFDNAKDLKVVIADAKVAISGDEAIVLYTRTDDFADARTGQPMHLSVQLTKKLRRTDAGWKLAPGK